MGSGGMVAVNWDRYEGIGGYGMKEREGERKDNIEQF
jgi:hypothetical protein